MAGDGETDELLTARQVQDLLKVDRTTIYRMLKDGRLVGLRVGQQWRFARGQVELLLAGRRPERGAPPDTLPLHCYQLIQGVFDQVAEVSTLALAPDGNPLTAFSRPCRFCELLLASESGRRACGEVWRRAAGTRPADQGFWTCHAGLHYVRSLVQFDPGPAVVLLAGQFYAQPPEPHVEASRLRQLAQLHHLAPDALAQAAREIPVLDERKRSQLRVWLAAMAQTFRELGRERAQFTDRLRRIAEMSTLTPSA